MSWQIIFLGSLEGEIQQILTGSWSGRNFPIRPINRGQNHCVDLFSRTNPDDGGNRRYCLFKLPLTINQRKFISAHF